MNNICEGRNVDMITGPDLKSVYEHWPRPFSLVAYLVYRYIGSESLILFGLFEYFPVIVDIFSLVYLLLKCNVTV